MKFVPFDDLTPHQWNAFCEISEEAWLYHDARWVKIESRHFWKENLSFGIVDRDELIGIQPLYLGDFGFEHLLHSGVHRHTGLALHPKLDFRATRTAQKKVMQHIFKLANQRDADRILLNAQNLAPVNSSLRRESIPFWVTNNHFHLGLAFGPSGMMPSPGMSTCNADQIVDLSLTEDELFSRLDDRASVRQGMANQLSIEPCTASNAVDMYYEIAELSAKRTGESLAPKAYYAEIMAAFGGSNSAAILVVRHEGKAVAAIFLLINKGGVNFMGGVSNPDYLPYRVNDFMHWSTLLWCKQQGYSQYRLGPSFPEVPTDWPIAKVSKFKTKFGGRSVPIIQGSFFRHPEKYEETAHAQLRHVMRALTSNSTPADSGIENQTDAPPSIASRIRHRLMKNVSKKSKDA